MTPVTPSDGYQVDWYNIGTMLGTWLSALIIIWRNRVTDRRKYNEQLNQRFDKIEKQTKEDHDAVRDQMTDMSETVSNNYFPKSQINTMIMSLQDSINGLRADMRHLTDRFDQFIGGRRGPHSDG